MFELNRMGGWIVPQGTTLEAGTDIPAFSALGDGCKLGDDYTVRYRCTLGNSFSHGDRLNWLGVKVESSLTLSNVDGSGRQLNLVKHVNSTVMVEAGCFLGTVDKFVAAAEDEGKLRYARLIPLTAANM